MVYATFSNKPFVTTKDILGEKKPLSEEARAIREYVHTHCVSAEMDSVTGKLKFEVSQNGEKN